MKRSILKILLLLIVAHSQSVFSQKLTRKEKKILKTIEMNNANAIHFLEKVVNINSGTMNHEGVKEVAMLFKDEFEKIAFKTNWIDLSEVNRSGHLFAETNPSSVKGKKLLLIGHFDTVFEENSPFQKFKKINDSIAHAPGGNDMKGGDVIILYALKALYENKLLTNAQIIAAFSGDEESSGKPLSISRKDLVDAAKRSDVSLGFETSTGFNNATVARRGSSGWKLTVEGKRAHSAGIFNDKVGAGAIFEMSRILNEFYNKVRGEKFLSFNPGVILGGTLVDFDPTLSKGSAFGKSNVVAQKVVVTGGLRFISEEQKENARKKMKEISEHNLPHTSAEISFVDSYPAMGPTKGNYQLLKTLNAVSLDLKQGEVTDYDPAKRGAADVSFVAKYVDCLDGLGTMGNGAHTPKETVNLKTIEALTKRTAILIYRLINQK
jgi:glutamate carboxypeptidase